MSQQELPFTQLDWARLELEGAANMFRRVNRVCFEKCILNYKEGDLSVGEKMCVERCVAKYIEVQMKANKKMQQQAQM